MGVTIGSNVASLQAQRRLSENSSRLSVVFERLASGQRINRASDDAAGLAISSSLNASSRVFDQARRNLNDGLSLLNIYDGALQQFSEILTRQAELAEQASNGIFSSEQRRALDAEFNSLVEEFNRIARSTEFNGMNLLGGGLLNMHIQAGYGANGSLGIQLAEELSRTVGDGTYTNGATYATTGSARTADFNGDGIDDIVQRNGGNYEVLLGQTDGTFTSATTYSSGLAGVTDFQLGDFNNDGIVDIAGASGSSVSTILGNGDGSFQSASITHSKSGLAIRTLIVGDINGDGSDDILTSPVAPISGHTRILLAQSDGSLAAGVDAGFTLFNSPASFGDVNGDGRDDLVTSSGGTISIYQGNTDGTLSLLSSMSGVSSGTDLELGDLNGDGILDIVESSSAGIETYLGTGGGTFESGISTTISGADDLHNLSLVDLNGDGALDILVSDGTDILDGVYTLLGDRTGQFGEANLIDSVIGLNGLISGDFNGDGAQDIIHTWTNPGAGVDVLFGDGEQVNTIAFQSLHTQEDAREVLTIVNEALERVSKERGVVGAFQARLQTSLNITGVTAENFRAAESRIKDIDVTQESAELVRLNILQQASTAILAQANLQPSIALSLLQ